MDKLIAREEEDTEAEAAATELANIQSAVVAMMVDNNKATLEPGEYTTTATNDMTKFPNPSGTTFVLYACSVNTTTGTITVNYVATQYTVGTYTVDKYGTVTQVTFGYE